MASCNLTEYIHDHECIGDSLKKINQNFINVESKVCEGLKPVAGPGISVDKQITEQKDHQFVISTTNSFDYRTTFDSYNNFASQIALPLLDQTTLNVTKFPYNGTEADVKPTTTFTTVSRQSDSIPKVTLYWTAGTTADNITVYPLNSAADEMNRGSIWFNETVTCLLSSSEKMYVGGAFTEIGGIFAQKLATINNTNGTGTFITEPIPNLGSLGEVRTIKEETITVSGTSHKLLIVGGSFESIGVRGRGLVILDQQTGLYYPWYVNGEVNSVRVYGNLLYVGGVFDYVNYGASSATSYSGQRLQTNGFFVINLPSMISGLAISSASNYSSPFAERAVINSFTVYDKILYIGGDFKIKQNDKIVNQNLYSIDLSPTISTTGPSTGFLNLWEPMPAFQVILNGPVKGLHIDNSIAAGGSAYLYVGGEFSKVYTSSEFYNEPRVKLQKTNASNAICFQLTDSSTIKTTPLLTTWKPNFRGAVTSFVSHDNAVDSLVYCYGLFNSVNDISVSYLTAIKKASSLTSGQVFPNWFPGIQNGPAKLNNSIIKDGNTLIIGGNFSEISGIYRYNLAKISCPISATFPVIVWDCGAEVISPGSKLTMDFYSSNTMRVSSAVFDTERVHATVFPIMPETFAGLTPGQPIRFFVRRPGKSCYTDDTFTSNAYVIGWKVDFNQ